MALKDKLMTLEDFKAVRDVDVASNSAQFTEIKADLDAYDNAIREEIGDIGWGQIAFTADSFIDLSGSTADVSHMSSPGFGFSCAVVQCSAGDKFLLNLTGGGRSRAWGFVASNGNIISVAEVNTTVSNYTLTAPTNAAYLVVHDSSGRKSYKKGETVAEMIESKGGLSDAAKLALMACFDNVAWKGTDGSSYADALRNALGLAVWGYSWDASSGVNPPNMTSSSFDFNAEPGALKAIAPSITFSHSGKFEYIVECKFPLFEGLNSPNLAIAVSKDASHGFAMVLRANNNTSVTDQKNKISYRRNYSGDWTYTQVNQTEYHTYRFICEGDAINTYIDGQLLDGSTWYEGTSPTGEANNAKIIGGTSTTMYMFIKSIKFREISAN